MPTAQIDRLFIDFIELYLETQSRLKARSLLLLESRQITSDMRRRGRLARTKIKISKRFGYIDNGLGFRYSR